MDGCRQNNADQEQTRPRHQRRGRTGDHLARSHGRLPRLPNPQPRSATNPPNPVTTRPLGRFPQVRRRLVGWGELRAVRLSRAPRSGTRQHNPPASAAISHLRGSAVFVLVTAARSPGLGISVTDSLLRASGPGRADMISSGGSLSRSFCGCWPLNAVAHDRARPAWRPLYDETPLRADGTRSERQVGRCLIGITHDLDRRRGAPGSVFEAEIAAKFTRSGKRDSRSGEVQDVGKWCRQIGWKAGRAGVPAPPFPVLSGIAVSPCWSRRWCSRCLSGTPLSCSGCCRCWRRQSCCWRRRCCRRLCRCRCWRCC
jgi:hypothetical protein